METSGCPPPAIKHNYHLFLAFLFTFVINCILIARLECRNRSLLLGHNMLRSLKLGCYKMPGYIVSAYTSVHNVLCRRYLKQNESH